MAVSKNKKINDFLDRINKETTPLFSDAKLNPKKSIDKDELDRNHLGLRNPNEALTEITANILNIMLHMTKKKEPNNKFLEYFNIERNFSLFQCAKVLHHFGIIDVNQLLENAVIRQTTNVIPYFILRAMLYHDPNKLFAYYQNNNSVCYFGRSKGSVILEQMLTSFTPEFRNDINTLIKFIGQNKSSAFMYQTLRMSVFG